MPIGYALILYVLSLVWGAVVSSDPVSAWMKLRFLVGGLAFYLLLSRVPSHVEWRSRDIPLLRVIVAAAPALMSAYFLVTNDWTQPVEKVGWLQPVRQRLSDLQVGLPWSPLHPNVVGGVLAMWLPLQVAALAPRPDSRRGPDPVRILRGPGAFLVGLSSIGLLLSGLRGAWLALAIAAGVWFWWWLTDWLAGRLGRPVRPVLWGTAAGFVVLAWATWGTSWLAVRPDRVLVWRNSWNLAWDYCYTGLGLGNFTMPYSSYALLVHVPHTTHAHNLLLDIWLEQGLLGVGAFAWLLLAALRADVGQPSRWRPAAVTSVLVVLVHGLLDDVYYGYGGSGALVLLAPVALLSRHGKRRPPRPAQPRGWFRVAVASGVTLVVIVALLFPATRARLHANLGALSQTRAELSVYRWPQWPLQDAVRRSDRVDLKPAIHHYRAALNLDPANAEANRRLGQIELSRGAYEDARRHLAAAFRVAPTHQATRQLFGESLAVTGEPTRAADLWHGLPSDQDQLGIRQWWYENLKDGQRARWVSEAIALVRNR